MNKSFSLQQLQKTSNLDTNLISRQYKLNLMADFMRVKNENPKLKQSQLANQLSLSSCTLQRNRNDKNMLSPYRIILNNTNKRAKKSLYTNFNNNSHREPDVKRPQMTSNDLKTTQTKPNKKNKNVLKVGSMQENVEINDQYFDETLDDNDI